MVIRIYKEAPDNSRRLVAEAAFDPLPRVGETIVDGDQTWEVLKVEHTVCTTPGHVYPPRLIVRERG